MQLVPKSLCGRCTLLVWLALCAAALVFAYVQQRIHDMPIAFFWFMVFLAMPIGYPVGALFGYGISVVLGPLGIPEHPFWSLVPVWVGFVVFGYLQWFVAVPFIVRALWRRFASNPSFKRTPDGAA